MQKTFILIIALLWSTLLPSAGQGFKGQINVINIEARQIGDQFVMETDIKISGKMLNSRLGVVLTPVLESDSNAVRLPELIINGKLRDISYIRSMRSKKNAPKPYRVIRVNRRTDEQVSYRVQIPYQSWMSNAKLNLMEDLVGPAGDRQGIRIEMPDQIQADEPQAVAQPRTFFVPQLCYITPEVEQVKNRNEQGSAYLDFASGKSIIMTDYKRNAAELAKVRRIVERVRYDKNVTITGVNIQGAASPDGAYQTNERLSKERALSFASYLQGVYDIPRNLYRVDWIGEDWAGLEKLVDSSDMVDKYLVLNIISNVGVFDGREADLMNLGGGHAYRFMKERFFPQLRRVSYQVDYTVRPFSIEEGRQIIATRPDQLSLSEMFRIANSYDYGSAQYTDIFRIAAQYYPGDVIANVNAAAAAIAAGDRASARGYLAPFATAPESWNNLGALYLMDGDYDTAEQYFEKAASTGNAQAIANLHQLQNPSGSK